MIEKEAINVMIQAREDAGGKGSPLSRWDYYEDVAVGSRLAGALCNCGTDKKRLFKGRVHFVSA